MSNLSEIANDIERQSDQPAPLTVEAWHKLVSRGASAAFATSIYWDSFYRQSDAVLREAMPDLAPVYGGTG